MDPADSRRAAVSIRHQCAPVPLVFPEEVEIPEGKVHLILRSFLYQLLMHVLRGEHCVGSNQFVYWNGRDPDRCLVPDIFVKRGIRDHKFGAWKTWERGGVPELAVEIVCATEDDGIDWDEKVVRYQELGVRELVRFDPTDEEGQRLRVWDRLHDDLVERIVEEDATPCLTLGLSWTVAGIEEDDVALRLADAEGALLKSAREQADAAREITKVARAEADRRVKELEERIRAMRGG
jgi:hypothetical protein